MDWFQIAEKASPSLLKNDYISCENIVIDALKSCPPSPFHATISASFTNTPVDVAAYVDSFHQDNCKKLKIKSIYAETNGFYINPDLWYFSLFGFEEDQGIDDLDWLSDWQAESNNEMTLTGMETIQDIYRNEKLGTDQADLSSLLIVVRFQELIFKARKLMKIGKISLYSTAHEFDFVARC